MQHPIYEALRPVLARLPADGWPTHEQLTGLAEGVTTAGGKALRFVAPREQAPGERRHYEARIAATGEVETRPRNWHDLFNALQWITYPRAKAQINAQHAAILEEGGEEEARRRSPERDALTLFDEGGVIVASSAPELLRLIVDFDWKTLFWQRRSEMQAKMKVIAFGHGLFEQSLAPYIGMVAKTVFVPASELFFMLPPESQAEQADLLLARHFASRLRFPSPKSMAPMPVLGVPGWHEETASESFYDIASYFQTRNPARPPGS